MKLKKLKLTFDDSICHLSTRLYRGELVECFNKQVPTQRHGLFGIYLDKNIFHLLIESHEVYQTRWTLNEDEVNILRAI